MTARVYDTIYDGRFNLNMSSLSTRIVETIEKVHKSTVDNTDSTNVYEIFGKFRKIMCDENSDQSKCHIPLLSVCCAYKCDFLNRFTVCSVFFFYIKFCLKWNIDPLERKNRKPDGFSTGTMKLIRIRAVPYAPMGVRNFFAREYSTTRTDNNIHYSSRTGPIDDKLATTTANRNDG